LPYEHLSLLLTKGDVLNAVSSYETDIIGTELVMELLDKSCAR